MLNDLGRLALALGALMGVWTIATSFAAVRTGRDGLLATARRGLAVAAACAMVATTALVLAMLGNDLSIRFVAANSSIVMPPRYIPAAILSAAGGALPAWAALVGVGAFLAIRSDSGREARAWGLGVAGGALGVALGVAALMDPLARHFGVAGDGAGLTPDLQREAAVGQSLALLIGSAAAAGGFVVTARTLAARTIDDAWSRSIRTWNAIAFASLLIGLVASARLFALDPARGPWLADRGMTLWLIAFAVCAWLVQLDSGQQRADRLVIRILLSAAAFISSCAAITLTGGAFARGSGSQVAPTDAVWFGILPMGALVVIVALLRRGKGAVASARGVSALPRRPIVSWLVRAGVIFIAGAAIGASFARDHDVALGDTEIFRVKDPLGHQWSFRSQGISTLRRENYASLTFSTIPERDGAAQPLLSAEARSYLRADGEEAAPPVIAGARRSGLFMETRLAVIEAGGARPTVRVAFVPLASWLLPGAALLCAGVLLSAAWPPGKERAS